MVGIDRVEVQRLTGELPLVRIEWGENMARIWRGGRAGGVEGVIVLGTGRFLNRLRSWRTVALIRCHGGVGEGKGVRREG